MWRKSVLSQFLLASLLLAGAAEARQAGVGGNGQPGLRVRGQAASTRTSDRSQIRLESSRGLVVQNGDVGSHIDPDGLRAHATIDPNG
jgi:hypothetical protein